MYGLRSFRACSTNMPDRAAGGYLPPLTNREFSRRHIIFDFFRILSDSEYPRIVVKGRTTEETAHHWIAKRNQLSERNPIWGHLFTVFL